MPPSNEDVLWSLVKKVDELDREIKSLRGQQLFSTIGKNGIVYSQVLAGDNGGANGNTLVNRYELAGLKIPSRPIIQMRFTFKSGAAEGGIITNAYVGHAASSGNLYDFSTTPVQLFWGGLPSVTIPSGGNEAVTDWALFPYDKASPLLVAYYPNGGIANDTFGYLSGLTNVTFYFRAATNEAGTVVKTAGYGSVSGFDNAISLIESNGF